MLLLQHTLFKMTLLKTIISLYLIHPVGQKFGQGWLGIYSGTHGIYQGSFSDAELVNGMSWTVQEALLAYLVSGCGWQKG